MSPSETPAGQTDLKALLAEGPLILFDGECVLCSGFVRFVIERERRPRYRFVPVQAPLGQALLAHFGLPLTDWESNVVIEDGRTYFKSSAFLKVAAQLRAPWPLTALGRILPRPLRDWCYDRVARNRYRLFGRQPLCLVPTPGLKARFLA